MNHIAGHGVGCDEAEDVVRHAKPPWPERGTHGRYRAWGRTAAGSYLQVVFIFPADEEVDPASPTLADLIAWSDGEDRVIYVIHARDLEDGEKQRYRKRSRKP